MKTKLLLIALSIAATLSCQKQQNIPTITADKSSIDAPIEGAIVDITLTCTSAVTAKNDLDWVTVTPGASTEQTYKFSLDVSEYDGVLSRSGNLTFKAEGAQDLIIPIKQDGTGILADWDLKALTETSKQTFAKAKDACSVGFNDVYAAPSSGLGKVEYYCCEKASYEIGGKNFYAVGANGDLYVNGTIEGDYWQITASCDTPIPAGTKIQISFSTNFGDRCTKYWMLSFKDGEKYTPVFDVQNVVEQAIRGLKTGKDVAISYSKEIEYNFCAGLREGISKSVCKYQKVEGTITTSMESKDIVFKFAPTGHVTLNGPAWTGAPDCYIDKISTDGTKSPYEHVTRITAQGNNDGAPSGTYDQHIIVKIVK